MPDPVQRYRGRFAPTPSGPLHAGSLLTALGSFLQARHLGGEWRIRIDDLDTPRNAPGAIDIILQQLDAHGLHWDGNIHLQSQHSEQYQSALDSLRVDDLLFACLCTRAELAAHPQIGLDGPVYDGHCRNAHHPQAGAALRIRVPPEQVIIDDRWQGHLEANLQTDLGDFVLRRKDGIFGYQLASVVDDKLMGITEVIRGADLIGSSLRQRYLAHQLGYVRPDFGHLPVLSSADGRKLSKQNHATPLDLTTAPLNLHRALCLLGQQPPGALATQSVTNILDWALAHWRPLQVPARASLIESARWRPPPPA